MKHNVLVQYTDEYGCETGREEFSFNSLHLAIEKISEYRNFYEGFIWLNDEIFPLKFLIGSYRAK